MVAGTAVEMRALGASPRRPTTSEVNVKRLGQLLLDFGWIEGSQLREALQTQKVVGGRIGSCLLEAGAVDEPMLLKALAHQRGVPAARTFDLQNVPEEVTSLLAPRVAIRCLAVPFRMLGTDLYVAMLDVDNLDLHDEIAFATGKQIRIHIANEVRIFTALHRYYGRELSERFDQLETRLDRPDPGFRRRSGFGLALSAGMPTESHGTSGAVNGSPPTATRAHLPRFEKLDSFSEALRNAEDRDEMAQLFVEQVRPHFRRMLLFRLLPDHVTGWLGSGEEVDASFLAQVEIALDRPSVFQDLRNGRPVRQGRLASLSTHRPVFQAFGGPPETCVALPIRLGKRVVCVLLGEPADDRKPSEVRASVIPACQLLGQAFGDLILRHRTSAGERS